MSIGGQKLLQLVLLLGSDKDGEVVAAARAIGRLLAKEKKDWHDLAKLIEGRPAAEERVDPPPRRDRAGWKPPGAVFLAEMEEWLDAPGLTGWEINFLASILDRNAGATFFAPSSKQAAVIERIKQKVRAYT